MRNKNLESTPGALYPNRSLSSKEISSYQKDIDRALGDNRITNIAITAPYGTGKSSVLESYFEIRKKSYPWYIRGINRVVNFINSKKKEKGFAPSFINEITDYEFINLPNFFKKPKENELQKKIIEQLLFSSDPKRYPFSKLKRIKDTRWNLDFLNFFKFLLVIMVPAYLFLIVTNKNSAVNEVVASFTKLNLFFILVISIFVISFLTWIIRRIRVFLSKSTISGKGKLGPFELSGSNTSSKDSSEIDIFNIFSEELLYFFRETNKKIIIFEDLDRFDDPKIFQELRELNININKRQSKVVFIYSLQDKVFDKVVGENKVRKYRLKRTGLSDGIRATSKNNKEETNTFDKRTVSKAKFFDFVVPIFPTTSLYNSYKSIEKELDKYKFQTSSGQGKLRQSFVKSMGLFLKDQRMIILIVSEFHSYFEMIESTKEDIDLEILFATIVYKNFYAKDFEKIANNNSLLNKVFDESEGLYSTLVDIKIKQLNSQKNKLEEKIFNLDKLIEYDTSRIIKSYFWEIISTKNLQRYASTNNYIMMDNKQYAEEDARQFFLDLIKLDKPVSLSFSSDSYGSRNIGTSQDVLSSIPDVNSFKVLLEEQSEDKKTSDLIQKLKAELLMITKKIKKIRQEVYGFTIGEVLRELVKLDIDSKDSELNDTLDEINKDNFKRYLFFNDYITSNFYSYISPVNFSDNKQDSVFIESVLSYREQGDYDISDPKNTARELDSSGANYGFAYSSNLLAYLFEYDDNKYKKEKDLILSKMIEKKDYQFWDNLITHSSKNDSIKNDLVITKEIILLMEKSNVFFRNSFSEISSYSNISLIYVLFNNLNEISLAVGEASIGDILNYLINDINSFGNFISAMLDNREYLEDIKFLDTYRHYLKIKNILNILEDTETSYDYEMIRFIYSEGLYIANSQNFEDFSKLFDISSSFGEVTEKLKKLNVKYLNLNDFYKYFKNKYQKNGYESYSGFNEYIDFCLGNHSFYTQFNKNTSLDLSDDDIINNCIESYSKVTLGDDDFRDKIMSKLQLIEMIENQDLEEPIISDLIESHKLNYSYDLLRGIVKSYSTYTNEYLLSIYDIFPDIFQEKLIEFNELIGEKEKLNLIKKIDKKKDYTYISSFLSYDDSLWNDLYQENPSFYDDKLADKLLSLNVLEIYKLLLKYTNEKIQEEALLKLLNHYPKKISLTELELITQDGPYFSDLNMKPDGSTHYDVNSLVPDFIMKVFDKLDIIRYTKNKQKITFHVAVRNYFKNE